MNSSSAAKRHRQSLKRRTRNKSFRGSVRTAVKKYLFSLQEDNVQQAEELFSTASRVLDTAGTKKIFHKNKIARTKSRLAKKLNDFKTHFGKQST